MLRFPIPCAAAVLLALTPGAVPAQSERGPADAVVIRQQVVIRVSRLSDAAIPAAQRPTGWQEKKGPKCVALGALAGALITQPDAVDLVFVGGARTRARLDDDCPALDFYSGFYLRPTRDGKICAGRDAVRARSGRKCGIDRFRRLVAKR